MITEVPQFSADLIPSSDPRAPACLMVTNAQCALTTALEFGSTGDCYDNAVVEAFWATLKRELAWIHNTTTWANRAELRSALFDYIEGFYNSNRIQRRLGHQSPADYEQHSAA